MSAYYDLYETPSPDGKEDKKSLHARICPKSVLGGVPDVYRDRAVLGLLDVDLVLALDEFYIHS